MENMGTNEVMVGIKKEVEIYISPNLAIKLLKNKIGSLKQAQYVIYSTILFTCLGDRSDNKLLLDVQGISRLTRIVPLQVSKSLSVLLNKEIISETEDGYYYVLR